MSDQLYRRDDGKWQLVVCHHIRGDYRASLGRRSYVFSARDDYDACRIADELLAHFSSPHGALAEDPPQPDYRDIF